LILLGFAGYALALPGVTAWGVTFDAHTLLFASLAVILGYQSIQFALFSKAFGIGAGLLPPDPRIARTLAWFSLESGLMLGSLSMLIGIALLAGAVNQWRLTHFGHLDYAHTMRWVIPGVTLTALGFQTVLSGFFLSILGLGRR